jgi:lysophospholipase
MGRWLAVLGVVACGDVTSSETEEGEAALSRASWNSESALATDAQRQAVVDSFQSNCTQSSFTASEKHNNKPYTIQFHVCPPKGPKKGAFAVVPGTTESSIRYAEFARDWTSKGYALYIMNNRGEGFNDRLLPDDPTTPADESQRRHMVDFSDYVSDLNDFVVKVVRPREQSTSRLMLVCHSMGGGICTRYSEVYPSNPFDGMMLSAPMQGIKTKFYENWIVELRNLTRPEAWVPNGGAFNPAEAFENNTLTRSKTRFAMRTYVNESFPEVQLGSPTYGWTKRALDATALIRREASKIKTPMLILSAQGDDIVDPASHKTVCDAINAERPKGCTLVPMMGSEHEVFIERDTIRNDAFNQMVTFMDRVAP